MDWEELKQRIKAEIHPGRTQVLKADGVGRRVVTSNRYGKIGMRTGEKTPQSKAITYEMIRHAFDCLIEKEHFDSTDFRSRFEEKYSAAPCRYSMTGGVLVELGIAEIVPRGGGQGCYYVRK